MATRILSCLIALTFVLSSTGPLTAAQPPQPPPPALPAAWGGEAPPPAPSAAAAAAAAADASIAALLAQATSVAAGEVHTCALTSAGGVKCWGSNYSGQLGDGTTTARSTPVAVVGLASGVVAVAAGDWHTCALTSAGGVQCWGNNRSGQLGDGTTTHRSTPVAVSGLASGVLAVAAGRHHTCAVTSAGGVQCWGANNYGQLGDGTTTDRSSPVAVSGLASGVAAVTAGEEHTCALTSAGGVQCWGYNLYGRLGDGTGTDRYTPVAVVGLASGVVAVAAGDSHTCALTSAGGVQCWGCNFSGQLGDGTTTNRCTPVAVSGLASGVVAVAAGGSHTCALTSAGGVQCWGNNWYGQLGDGTTTHRSTPVAVSGLASGVVAVAAGGWHTCALTSAGGVQCWGFNWYGQLGDGMTTHRSTPVAVSGLASGVAAVTAGGEHTCALTSAGGVQCWGYNLYGQLGDGTETNRYTPVAVSGLASGVAAVAAGDGHTCAVTSAGGVQCWGRNYYGQLGDGTWTNHPTPVAVVGLASGVAAVAAGEEHTCAVTSAGGVQCWGCNFSGQLGDGTTTNRCTPVAVSGLASGVVAVAAGGSHTCALTSAGGVLCWGDNVYGQLGDGTTTHRSTPVAVSGLASGVLAVAAGRHHTCALTSAGGVQCWGDNGYGQLGDGTTTDRRTPVAVSGLASGVVAVVAGGGHTCAVTSAGGVQCWGDNYYSQLGDGTTTGRSAPVAVSGLASGVAAVAAGGHHTCAVTSVGGVQCWGGNTEGQLGVDPGWMPVNVVGFEGVVPYGRTIFLPVISHGSGGGG